jgi:NADPH:quinone reductase-like Zn-dependent oxidoreductase
MTSATTPVPGRRDPELAGQTVIVIGGSAGIGFETARHARAEGADVILTGRNPDRLKQAAAVPRLKTPAVVTIIRRAGGPRAVACRSFFMDGRSQPNSPRSWRTERRGCAPTITGSIYRP